MEIFALKNSYDPLIALGRTDEKGSFSVLLNGGKEYVVIVKTDDRRMIGVANHPRGK